MPLVARAALVLAVLPLLAGVRVSAPAGRLPTWMPSRKKFADVIRRQYADPRYFNYIEQGRDVDVSSLGKVSVGPMRTFGCARTRQAGRRLRLIAIDGKPLDQAELAQARRRASQE